MSGDHCRSELGRRSCRGGGCGPGSSTELRRNASSQTWRFEYKASLARLHGERRARRPKVTKLVANERYRRARFTLG